MASGRVEGRRRLRAEVQGLVQGVGFRPFVYRLASELALSGWVINDTRGVFIEVEGPHEALERFSRRLGAEAPPRARIERLEESWLAPAGYTQFDIRHSEEAGARTTPVLPDIASCPDCLAEAFDPEDRRHRYPFTNCTNCGPRFSIIQSLPYDRPHTTMSAFTMCSTCQKEYDEPRNRRFHAQPNACPDCGPRLALMTPEGETRARDDAALKDAVTALRAGRIVAVKGLGGFHLMADARNARTVDRLRDRKPRREKPFALMVRDIEQARELCELPAPAEALLVSPEAPILLLARRGKAPVAANVAPGNPNLGIMLPTAPMHHLLLREAGFPVVATSGNLSDEPICTDEVEALSRLGHIAELFLVHDRPIARHVDDSVGWIVRGEMKLLRRARGYAPAPVTVRKPLPTILAVGGHLKNTVALSVEDRIFVSQHIGDLDSPESLSAFQHVIEDFLRLYEARPAAVACDLHPDYLSTRWAESAVSGGQADPAHGRFRTAADGLAGLPLIPVQHHHAHLAACLAESGVEGPALGVIWDGTGFGTDGTVWGGEMLLGSTARFTRAGHLFPFRLPGGEAAVREPRRSGLAVLWEVMGEACLEREDLPTVRAHSHAERPVLARMLARGINAPVTTSAGRLFDAVSSLIGLRQRCDFEGQAAMALEFAADPAETGSYPISIDERAVPPPEAVATPVDPEGRGAGSSRTLVVDWRGAVEAILEDLRRGVETGIISARFHNTLVEAILAVAGRVGERRVALAGGCFQNRWLTERAAGRLEEAGFEVLVHRQVPPNDGSISLGQAAAAAARLETGLAG
jgi:hydrogenase maturation protein HypF